MKLGSNFVDRGDNVIEGKVSSATTWTYLGTLGIIAILNGVTDINLVASLPDVLEVFVAPLIPAALSFFGGYAAKHTPLRGE